MAIKEKDFIEVEYTAKEKETGNIFDTTDEKTAKDAGIYQEGQKFGSVVVCIGQGHLLKGLELELIGKEAGDVKADKAGDVKADKAGDVKADNGKGKAKKYSVELKAENAFGKKSAKMIQLIATNKFTKEGIRPQPGMQVNVDGMFGIVKTVTGGRVMVDFNHPLSGKDVIYTVKINKLVTDTLEKAKGLVSLQLGKDNVAVELRENDKKEKELTIKIKMELGKEYEQKFSDMIHELVPELKKIIFIKG
ncbi:MAG: hypothetical protein ABIG89_01405 [Candidatus Woesearchaeota archaeon]